MRNNWLPAERKITALSTTDLIKFTKKNKRRTSARHKKSSVNEYSGLAGNYAAFSTLSYLSRRGGKNEDFRGEMREIPGQVSYSKRTEVDADEVAVVNEDDKRSNVRKVMMRSKGGGGGGRSDSKQKPAPTNWILLPATWQEDPSAQGSRRHDRGLSEEQQGQTWSRRSQQHYFSHHYQPGS